MVESARTLLRHNRDAGICQFRDPSKDRRLLTFYRDKFQDHGAIEDFVAVSAGYKEPATYSPEAFKETFKEIPLAA